jgi:ACS family hexuronate transporter-like MFS transporter
MAEDVREATLLWETKLGDAWDAWLAEQEAFRTRIAQLIRWLLRRGHGLNLARKAALGASATVMPLILLVTHVPVGLAMALFSIAFFGQQPWSILVMIVPTDLFPRNNIGAVAGLVGFGGAMGGILFGFIAGHLLDRGFGYGPVFAVVGTFHIMAFLLILVTIPRIGRLQLFAKEVCSS